MNPIVRILSRSPRRHGFPLVTHRSFSTASSGLEVDLSHPIYTVWGSNTGVGKTLVSAGLASAVLSPSSRPSAPSKFLYVKPVQTGFPEDSDSRFVYHKMCKIFLHQKPKINMFASNQAVRTSLAASRELPGFVNEEEKAGSGLHELCLYEERRMCGADSPVDGFKLTCKMLYGWREAISPHLAAEREGATLTDAELLDAVKRCLQMNAGDVYCGMEGRMWSLIETAGGVASPGPSGSLQCDIYRNFRFPVILVGDGRLGGISGTISSYESLKLRGYDVVAIIIEDHGLFNEKSLSSYLGNRVPVIILPPVPKDKSNDLMDWFSQSHKVFSSLKEVMLDKYLERVDRFREMPRIATRILWWPFTQHKLVPVEGITVIDSRYGENFAVHMAAKDGKSSGIAHQFDACGSWWTQGPDAALQIELARDLAYAAARFGHVMFPENVHEPALRCAELLLDGVGKGWASRVYFSDNGSTAVEIALKMAFRKYSVDHGILLDPTDPLLQEKSFDFKVLALNGSYHGDTLGSMEAQAPSPFTGFLQQPWYTGRGLFLDPPTVFLRHMVWNLQWQCTLYSFKCNEGILSFSSCSELFSRGRDTSELAQTYSNYISQQLSVGSRSSHIAALIIEPVIQGAGGMHMIDPLFQRVLVRECHDRHIPVIYDEVFTGFWRLGVESAAELLDCQPDIACYGKLFTGGVIPLAATVATDAVFNAFNGDSKLVALLHGHSYSAHPLGCSAAVKAMQWFKDPFANPNIIHQGERLRLRELWDSELVHQLSSNVSVKRVVSLGTLCSIELIPKNRDAGYASLDCSSLVKELRDDGIYMRPLGNVIYLLCGPCTNPQVCHRVLKKVCQRINSSPSG